MKFFKNTLIVEEFFNAFPDVKYDKKTYKLIAKDFELGNRVSKPETIISKIEAMENPKQYILDRLHAEITTERKQAEENIELWSTNKLRSELKKVHVSDFYHDDHDELCRKLRAHRDNTLEWEAYDADWLKYNFDSLHIKHRAVERSMDDARYRKYAAEMLDFYDDGELLSGDFYDVATYRTFVSDRLTAFGLPNDGDDADKQVRLTKRALTARGGSLDGTAKELKERLLRFQFGKTSCFDLSPSTITNRLEENSAYTEGSLEQLTQRLIRFETKRAVTDDYSSDWVKKRLKEYKQATNGNRQDLLERYKIISLTKENERLRQELEYCRRRRPSYRPRSSKREPDGPGFYTGLAVGALGGLISRVQEKSTLTF